MRKAPLIPPEREQTPVDDVRRIRCRLSRQAGGNIHRQIEQSEKVAKLYCRKLGLHSAISSSPPLTGVK